MMADTGNKQFKWRAFTSVATAVSFLAVSLSGIVLFVTPTGRVAHWTGWTMLSLTKDQWGSLHIWFGLIFLVAGVCHTAFNWRVLVAYFRSKARQASAFKPEWVLVLLILVLVSAGTLLELPPFASLIALNESIKDSWEVPGQQAPIPHAELMTLQEIAAKVDGADADAMVESLREAGVTIESPHAIIGDLAKQQHKTPSEIYVLAVGEDLARASSAQAGLSGACRNGRGLGRLTLRQYCEQTQLEPSEAIRLLQAQGYEAKPDMLMRDIAHAAGVHVSDLQDVLAKP
jgi:hypothetical protein